ncbi:MAG TPA: nucleotide exchange factor GrpE [bacterium]|nr:nucleotide exchange factor GrpE [bacterium]HNS48430.1 nucleotide exchange factor GrpE [bacterium]
MKTRPNHNQKSPEPESGIPARETPVNPEAASEKEMDAPAPETEADPGVLLKEAADRAELLQEKMLRLAAEFDNFRKRTSLEKERLTTDAAAGVLAKLLPVLDSLDQFQLHAGSGEAEKEPNEGLAVLTRQLAQVFQACGLERLELKGRMFDPHYAEAVEIYHDPEAADGVVLEVLRAGYRYRERILRPALVRINRRPDAEADSTQKPGPESEAAADDSTIEEA